MALSLDADSAETVRIVAVLSEELGLSGVTARAENLAQCVNIQLYRIFYKLTCCRWSFGADLSNCRVCNCVTN